MHLFEALFLDFQIQQLAILKPVEVGKSHISQKKPYNVPFESNTETGRISVMKGSRRVLVKVVLFWLRGHSQPQNDATDNFFANSERPILGLSKNEVSFVAEILWKDG